jgi:hypothetical protein
VRSRICLAIAATAAVSLVVVATGSAAAAPAAKGTPLKCHLSLSTTPPAGSASVNQPPANGSQYGPAHCPSAAFGGGTAADTFTVVDDGDTIGKYVEYFNAGSIHGTFDLTPSEGSGNLTPTSFEAESWTGTITVLGGTGVYKGVKGLKGKKNLGVFNCTSPDSVHLTCTERVRVQLP